MSFTTDSVVEPNVLGAADNLLIPSSAAASAPAPTDGEPADDAVVDLPADAVAVDPPPGDAAPAEEPADELDGVPAVLRPALQRRGFTRLTDVQQAVLRAQAEAGEDAPRDLRISSQTGSGKTVAIGFVLAPQLATAAGAAGAGATSTVLIVPTRELADQVGKELAWLFADLRHVQVECVTGGTSVVQEQRRLQRRPRVVVGTPGRLLDHLRSGALDGRGVSEIVLDEADQMLDMGFRDDLDAILQALPARRRTHMVSATFPPEVQRLAEAFQSAPVWLEGTRLGAANVDIEHHVYRVHARDRYAALVNLLLMQEGERTLVFVRTRQDTTGLAEKLAEDGFSAMPLSGELVQAQRTRTLNAFRSGVVTALIATDVAARGLDVPDVNVVVHFDLPMDDGVYTHRSGRTGRAGRKGRSITLVPPSAVRKAQRMLRSAKVTPQFSDAPGPAAVAAALDERARGRLQALLDTAEAAAKADCELARTLLEGRDPVQVVAKLVASARTQPARAPMPLGQAPMPFEGERTHAARGPYRSDRPERPDRADAGGGQRTRAAAYVRFAINWGGRRGATAQRLLAHVCRRGGIAGAQVGVIEVLGDASTFEVDARCADQFAERVRVPDPREPHLVIVADGRRPRPDSTGRPLPSGRPLPPARSARQGYSGGYGRRERRAADAWE